jgi:hypothetical protein
VQQTVTTFGNPDARSCSSINQSESSSEISALRDHKSISRQWLRALLLLCLFSSVSSPLSPPPSVEPTESGTSHLLRGDKISGGQGGEEEEAPRERQSAMLTSPPHSLSYSVSDSLSLSLAALTRRRRRRRLDEDQKMELNQACSRGAEDLLPAALSRPTVVAMRWCVSR